MSLSRSALCALGLLSVGALSLLASRPANAELIGVASASPGAIYSINQGTGSASLLTATPGTRPSFTGAEFRQGVLYASDVFLGGDYVFGSYDLMTGAFTQISDQASFLNLQGLAYRPSNDLFYSVEAFAGANSLVTIHPFTGAVTTIGNTNTLIRGLAFDQGNDILYGVTGEEGVSINLVTINVSSGMVTTIGATGQTGYSAGLAFDEDNDVLYMNLSIDSSTSNSLFTINTTTGAATLVGANGAVAGQGIDGLAWRSSAVASAAPEPGSLALLALAGLPMVGAVVRQNRVSLCRRKVAA